MAKKTTQPDTEASTDWSAFMVAQENQIIKGEMLKVGDSLTVKFLSLKQVTLDEVLGLTGIVATVESDLGDTLWLHGKYGAQNGWFSLVKAADNDPENIIGNTFTLEKVDSDKSPAGFAYHWGAV